MAMEYFYPRDSEVWVKVLEVREDNGQQKVGLSMKLANQESGEDLAGP